MVLLNAIQDALERSHIALQREMEMHKPATVTVLSARERQVMTLVVGLLNKQVGGELGISEVT